MYIPPNRQPDGAMSGQENVVHRRKDQYAIKVSKLPKDAKQQDLYDLFLHFGKIQRVFLAKDKVTCASKVVVPF